MTLRLYLKNEYHSRMVSENMWRHVAPIFKALGVKRLGISEKTNGLGNTDIPAGFKQKSNSLKRFQTVAWNDSTALFDISGYPANAFGSMTQHVQDMAMIGETASGVLPSDGISDEIETALSEGAVIQKVNARRWLDKIMFRIRHDMELKEGTEFKNFLETAGVTVNVVRPPQEELSAYGLAVATGKDGKDVYAVSKWSEDSKVDIFVSEYSWDHADDDVRREIIAHQLYKAYVLMHRKRSSEDIDLEIKIDQELRKQQLWQNMIGEEEKTDLGLSESAPLLHLRARAFARLMGTPSRLGVGSAYTDFLRLHREIKT